MTEEVFGRPYVQTPRGPEMEPCAPHAVLARMGDKWTILVVSLLSLAPGNRLRFSELQRGVKGVSQRMLTLTLRNLEKDGLITRQVFPEVPPRVEYELTALGVSLLPALEIFTRWIKTHWLAIEASRRAFELRKE